jgi:hypothetical protein
MSKNALSYDTIGTASVPATLTAAYTGNTKTLLSKYLTEIHIDVAYTPKTGQTNRVVNVLVEVSNDERTTFFPLSLRTNTTTGTSVYVDDAAGANGLPAIIPGDATSTGGATLKGFIDLNDMTADHVKISAKESGSDNFGTVYVRTTLSSKSS